MTCEAFCTEAFLRGTPFCRNQISRNHAFCRADTENNNSICTSLMSKCSSEISTRIEKYSKQTHVLWHVTPKNASQHTHTPQIYKTHTCTPNQNHKPKITNKHHKIHIKHQHIKKKTQTPQIRHICTCCRCAKCM